MSKTLQNIYQYVASEEDARVCREISDSACKVVPGNFFTIFITQFLTQLADALASARVVLPWLMANAGAPAFLSGLLVPIRESGSLLPQLVIGGYVRQHAIRKWFFVAGSALQGVSVGLMALAGFTLQGIQAGITIISLLILFSLARGLCSVASKDVLGKTIPKSKRGLLSGYCASAAGFITIAVGTLLSLQGRPDTQSFTWLLIAAALCWLIAAIAFMRVREYAGATEGGGNALKEAFANLGLLNSDRAFRRFVVMRSLLMSSGLAAPYFIILARQSSDDSALRNLGIFIIVGGLASLLSGVIWGKLADFSSRKVMLMTALATALLCGITSLLASSDSDTHSEFLVALFFALTVTHQGVRLGRKTYVVDLADGNRRTDYVAVSNTLIGALLLLIGLLSALVAQYSITSVMLFFAISSSLAFWVGLGLPEA